jgi:hypothetical protein
MKRLLDLLGDWCEQNWTGFLAGGTVVTVIAVFIYTFGTREVC